VVAVEAITGATEMVVVRTAALRTAPDGISVADPAMTGMGRNSSRRMVTLHHTNSPPTSSHLMALNKDTPHTSLSPATTPEGIRNSTTTAPRPMDPHAAVVRPEVGMAVMVAHPEGKVDMAMEGEVTMEAMVQAVQGAAATARVEGVGVEDTAGMEDMEAQLRMAMSPLTTTLGHTVPREAGHLVVGAGDEGGIEADDQLGYMCTVEYVFTIL